MIHHGPTAAQIRLFQEVGRRLDRRGLIASNDGNLSVRDPDGTILITATGSRKGYLKTDEIVRVDAQGKVLSRGRGASSECHMHREIYRTRPDISAVVHAHPPIATGFAVAREAMDACVLPEIIATLGAVPLAPYGTPGTSDLGGKLMPFVQTHDVVLLANHGAVALGPDLEEAYFRMERLEHTARILLTARLLGNVERLSGSEVEVLLGAGGAPGAGARLPCVPGTTPGPAGFPGGGALAEIIRQVLESRGYPPGCGDNPVVRDS